METLLQYSPEEVVQAFSIFMLPALLLLIALQSVIILFLLKKFADHEIILMFHQKILDTLYPNIAENLDNILEGKPPVETNNEIKKSNKIKI